MKRFFSGSVVAVAAIAGLAILVAPGCGTEEPVDLGQIGKGPVIAKGSAALTVQGVCSDPNNCAASGAHGGSTSNGVRAAGKHSAYDCKVCHFVGGMLAFQPGGPAYGTGQPAPTFDATAKTCSNIACHSVPAGTYSYTFPSEDLDGDGYLDPVPRTVNYGGASAGPTPSWYATGAGCSACHNLTYNGIRYTWHSGYHANPTIPNANACQLCHFDATGTATPSGPSSDSALIQTATCPPNSEAGGSKVCSTYHANQSLNVTATFSSRCFNCH